MTMSFDPFSDLDRLTSQLGSRSTRLMPVDLFREGDRYVLAADLPGIDPGSVDVDLDGHVLTIRAERTAASHESAKWLARERPYGSYVRQFSLGDGIDTEGISAHYDNGVLSVVIPVSERARPRKIDILGKSEQSSISA
ncbi:Hsp20/alpha crystallin family protein [Aeromicrobium ginsengisoli]|uniref:Hsp20/alpha crystallin family protein n=2 Tax=Aeromicrobium ginsengisoli TaxID=363867 RepID=A0A5M4FCE7_9ACTN|nr:Hsp20/alpha crystallin family protein [Aeromicrobium ginsengisoli]